MKRDHIFLFLFSAFTLFLLLYFHTHGFIYYDDGWFLQAAARLQNGEMLFKDFQYYYNPGSLYLNIIGFMLFGKSMLASHMIAFFNSIFAAILLSRIGRHFKLKNPMIGMLVLSYIFWGPGHINFVWPVMFCLTLGLMNGFLFLRALKSRNKNIYFLLAGISSAFVFILKQNFGLAILLADIIFIVLVKTYRKKNNFFSYLSGYAFIILLQFAYFLFTGTLSEYIDQFYFYTIIKIGKEGILNSPLPWEYPSPFSYKILKGLFYFLPAIISILALMKLFKNKNDKVFLYFPLISLTFFALSFRPTTDYVHLTPLLAISIFPLFIVYKKSRRALSKFLIYIFIVGFCVFGGYSSLFKNYYRWQPPLITNTVFSNNPTVRIWTTDTESENIDIISDYFEQNAQNEKYVFVYSFSPIYYLLLNKENPTRHDYVHPGILTLDVQREIVEELKEKKVKFILTDVDISSDKSLPAVYIKSNFTREKKVNKYTIWRIKERSH